MKLIAVTDTLWKKSLLICVIPNKIDVVHPNISPQNTCLLYFWSIWPYSFGILYVFCCVTNRKVNKPTVIFTTPVNRTDSVLILGLSQKETVNSTGLSLIC